MPLGLEYASGFPDRIARLLIGPSGGTGREFKSPLMGKFKVSLTNGSKPNKAEFKVYNLGYDTVNFLERSGNTVQFFVGEGSSGRLFKGDISSRGILTTVDPPNRITTIKCADGRRIWRSTRFVKSYSPGITRSAVLQDLIAASGLPLGYLSPKLKELIFATGWAHAGKWRSAMTKILAIDGARYSIQQGSLYIVAAGEAEPGNAPLITPRTGLKKSPTRTKKGVSIETVLDPRIRPGRALQLISTGVTGDFKCVKADHSGDFRGIEWTTKAEAVPLRR